MNKPILFVVYISVATCLGFILCAMFGAPNTKEIVYESISQRNEIDKLLTWESLAIQSKREL